jgi:hypothetical protein
LESLNEKKNRQKTMSVIIDQFEVVLDSQENQEAKSTAANSGAQQASAIRPRDITAVYEQMRSRQQRVYAH